MPVERRLRRAQRRVRARHRARLRAFRDRAARRLVARGLSRARRLVAQRRALHVVRAVASVQPRVERERRRGPRAQRRDWRPRHGARRVSARELLDGLHETFVRLHAGAAHRAMRSREALVGVRTRTRTRTCALRERQLGQLDDALAVAAPVQPG